MCLFFNEFWELLFLFFLLNPHPRHAHWFYMLQPGIKPKIYVCTLNGNRTRNLLVYGATLQPSHTSPDENYPYIPDTSALLELQFENIFPQYVACWFIPLTGSFTEENLFVLMSNLSIFPFMGHVFVVKSKNLLLALRCEDFLLKVL